MSSLLVQDDSDPFELILLDNGSTRPLEATMNDVLKKFRGPVKILREEDNILGPLRWIQAISASESEFVLLPGDDDLALPNYISTSRSLAASSDSVTIISSGMRAIDSSGKSLPEFWRPPHYRNQQEAIAKLLCSNGYPMPSSGFRKSSVDLHKIPRTRTAVDWALWLNAWITGTAAVDNTPTILYRQHSGQEQRAYSPQAFRLDAARMLIEYVSSDRFRELLASWNQSQLDEFSNFLLESTGLNGADTRWAPIVQIALADLFRDVGMTSQAVNLYAQASAQGGVIPDLGSLRCLAETPYLWAIPPSTWTRVPIGISWESDCQLSQAWRIFLDIPEEDTAIIRIVASCNCKNSNTHILNFIINRKGVDHCCEISVTENPSASSSYELLESIGKFIGRRHGFEVMSKTEETVMRIARKLQRNRLRAFLAQVYQRGVERWVS